MCEFADLQICGCADLVERPEGGLVTVPRNIKGAKATDGTKLLIFSTYVF